MCCVICYGMVGKGDFMLGVFDLIDVEYFYGVGIVYEIEEIVCYGI